MLCNLLCICNKHSQVYLSFKLLPVIQMIHMIYLYSIYIYIFIFISHNNTSSTIIQPSFPHPAGHFFDHQLGLTCCSCLWNLPFSQRSFLLKRFHSNKNKSKHKLFFTKILYKSNPSVFPFLTKDLFIGYASETTPFSQRFCFPFFKGPNPSIG